MSSAGFAAVSYPTPEAILDAAPGLAAGCILLDIRMPGMDGLMLQAELRARGGELPVIVMTGQGRRRDRGTGHEGGAADFIEKPFSDEVLVTAIEAALGKVGQIGRDRDAAAAAQRVATLSPREREVPRRPGQRAVETRRSHSISASASGRSRCTVRA